MKNVEDVFNRRFMHLPLYPLTQDRLEYMADSILESMAEIQKEKVYKGNF